jgi:lipoprotein-anchoring transpeptidase ErfK/SrfK
MKRRVVSAFLLVVALSACEVTVTWDAPPAASLRPSKSAASRPHAPSNAQHRVLEELAVLPETGTFVARSLRPELEVWRRPSERSGRKFVIPTTNPVGQNLAFLVTGSVRDDDGSPWLRVLVPVWPNEAAGWVKRTEVRVRRAHERIVVDLSERTLRHFLRGELAHRFDVGIGTRATPTAIGTFYVWARVPQASPTGAYGIFALGLSGFSEVLRDWPGGGRMAIHGTADASDRGGMNSHGCVRVYNSDMRKLTGVPLGTPVIIRR